MKRMPGLLIIASLGSLCASGSVTYFDNLAGFQTTVGSTTLIDFNNAVNPPAVEAFYPGKVTFSGVTFTGTQYLNASTPQYHVAYDFGTEDTLVAFGGDRTVAYNSFTFAFPAMTYAVGFELANSFATAGIPGSFTVSLSTGETRTIDAIPARLVFFGVSSTQPISGLSIVNNTPPATYYQITSGHPFTILDNVRFAAVSSVPEPGTGSLMLGSLMLGSLMLGAAGRRLRG